MAGSDATLTAAEQSFLDGVRALCPALINRVALATANRDVPTETIADYHRLGILRILQPRRFGGHQLRFCLFSRIVEELAGACASSAWVYAVLGEHQWIIASYPAQAQEDVWGTNPLAVASSSLAPRAAAERVDGGWRLSGRYPFSSGSSHAQWAIIGAFLGDSDAIAYLLVPMAEAEIIDDWHVLGLAGTGSRSLSLRDVFVPEHRMVLLDDLMQGAPPGRLVHPDYPLLAAPRGLLVPYSLPPVAVALGRRALAHVAESLRVRVSRGVTRMADSEFVQMTLGEAAAAIELATLTLHNGRLESERLIAAGEPIPPQAALRARRDMVYGLHQVQTAVEHLCELSGARSVYASDGLLSIRRDVLTILTHSAASRQHAMGAYGRFMLGTGT